MKRKILYSNLIFILLFLILGMTAKASNCESLIGTCDYYTCINSEMSCVKDDYFLRFARPYCQKFDQRMSRFSQKGQEVVSRIKTCLQLQMESLPTEATCKQLEDIALQHHHDCYLSEGFCELSHRDKMQIFSVVYKELKRSSFRREMFFINGACAERHQKINQISTVKTKIEP